MPWQAIMLLQNLCASGYALFSRSLAVRYKGAHFQILALIFLVLWLVGLLSVLAIGKRPDIYSIVDYWPRYILGGVVFGVWSFYSYKVFEYVDAAIASLLSILNIVAVIVAASVLLREALTPLQLAGSLLLMLSMLLIFSAKVAKRTKNRWVIATMLSLVASSTYGLAITNEKWLLERVGLASYVLYGFGMQFLVLFVMSLIINRKQYKYLRKKDFCVKVLGAGVVRGFAGLLFILSLVAANSASLISVLSGFKVILTAVLAAVLLRERNLLARKLAAAGLAVLAVTMLTWK